MAIHVQYSAFIELSQCQGCMVAKSIVLSLFSTAVSATAVLIQSVPGEQVTNSRWLPDRNLDDRTLDG